MKQALRSRATAAAILVALCGGTAFVATPAVAAPSFVLPSYAPHEMLSRFEVVGPVTTGSTVTFRVRGLPNGVATVDVPGILNHFELKEVSSGVYENSFHIAPAYNPAAFLASRATLRVAGHTVEARVGSSGFAVNPPTQGTPIWGGAYPSNRPGVFNRDRRGPDIGELSPANGERVRDRRETRVSARFSDDASGIGDVNLRVDGRDVTHSSRIANGRIDYRADLAPGRHVAELAVRDQAGNLTRRSWTFEVDDNRRYGWNDSRRW